jgi:aldehyde dehydrogenase (NAD+)
VQERIVKIIDSHFFGGVFVASHGQETIDVRNPTSNELVGRVTKGAVNAERAIAAAKAALPA